MTQKASILQQSPHDCGMPKLSPSTFPQKTTKQSPQDHGLAKDRKAIVKATPAEIQRTFVADSFDSGVNLICNNDDCTVIRVANDTGEGIMTLYIPFPGVYVAYNDYHLSNYDKGFSPSEKTFCINHCHEGRIEWRRHDGLYCYFETGDLLMSVHPPEESGFAFPLKHYHGISIAFFLPRRNKRGSRCGVVELLNRPRQAHR